MTYRSGDICLSTRDATTSVFAGVCDVRMAESNVQYSGNFGARCSRCMRLVS